MPTYGKSGEDVAEQAAGCLLGGIILAIAGIVKVFNELLGPTPQGITVGCKRTSLGIAGPTVGIPPLERLKHTHIIGPTGSGKTTLLTNLILQDIRAGNGLAVIDPKGDLTNEILTHIPITRYNDVILFDPTDRNYPVGFNILEAVSADDRSRTASEVVSVFEKLFAYSWGPRLEHILRYTVLLLLEVPGSTLLDIPMILQDDDYRDSLLTNVANFTVRRFWEQEYKSASPSRRQEAIWPILNKVGPWLAYPEVRNIVGQVHSSFSLRTLIDTHKILLVNIPQGILGEDTSSLIGAMLVSKIQLAAMTRAGLPQAPKPPFFLYVDEFQNFVTSSFEKIVTEARSFGLGLIVSNQYEQQLSRDLSLALNHNVAVRLTCSFEQNSYRVAYQKLQEPNLPPLSLVPLPPPAAGDPNLPKQLRVTCRQKYSRPRREVEAAIYATMAARSGKSYYGNTYDEQPRSGPTHRTRKKPTDD